MIDWKKSIPSASTLIILYLLYAWREARRKTLYYKKNNWHKSILEKLQPVLDSYSPTFWLPSPYLKTAFLGGSSYNIDGFYQRRKLVLDDGEKVAFDLYPPHFDELDPKTPILIFKPGIIGSSGANYIINCCKLFEKELNWRVGIVNRRGFGGMKITVN